MHFPGEHLDWFIHDPGQGRVGPYSADALRTRYRERRIQLDTLVWREGMREWQPLDRMAEELDLLSVKPDTSLPPPLPPAAALHAPATAGMANAAGRSPGARPRKRMSGCLLAALVGGVAALVGIAILAAIAVPTYNEYLTRSKVVAQVDARAPAVQAAVAQAMANTGRCPGSAQEAGIALVGVDFGNVDGRCAFQMTVQGIGAAVDGKSVVFVAPAEPGGAWDCTGGDLPAPYRRPQCRATSEPTL